MKYLVAYDEPYVYKAGKITSFLCFIFPNHGFNSPKIEIIKVNHLDDYIIWCAIDVETYSPSLFSQLDGKSFKTLAGAKNHTINKLKEFNIKTIDSDMICFE